MANEKKEKKAKKKLSLLQKIILAFFILLLLLVFFIGGISYSIIKNAPAIDPEELYARLSESSYLYDDNGDLYERLISDEYRTNIRYSDMPDNLINAFIAIEDKTFWEHHGFNFVRLFGAVVEGFQNGEDIRGTSTITQQLARNLYLSEIKSERTLSRKLIEAYYTVILERSLTKKEILEAYLNTIYLGYGANGVQAASHAYFDKDVKDLSIAECALFAAITPNPSRLSPVRRLPSAEVDPSDPNLLSAGKLYTTLYRDTYKSRHELVLREMYNLNLVSFADYRNALKEDIRAALSSQAEIESQFSSYFSDYVIVQVAHDISRQLKIDENDAYTMLYNSGLKIHSTVNVRMQMIVEAELRDASNYPNFSSLRTDRSGNILTADGRVMLRDAKRILDQSGNVTLASDEYRFVPGGPLTLLKDRRLLFQSVTQNNEIRDLAVQLKDLYRREKNTFYYYSDLAVQIPAEEKTFDAEGNLLISAAFLNAHENLFRINPSGELVIDASICLLSDPILQPQGAMAVIDHQTGHIKALVGGRDSGGGKLLFNRATAPHPPGSSIKPLGVYIPALLNGWTAASTVEDAPLTYEGRIWPRNAYAGYKGVVTLRTAVESSMNVPAVKVNLAVTPEKSVELLKQLGITTVVESGPVNDVNPAAMALGGMTYGISPLEMTAAYGTIANGGIYQTPIAYTQVLMKNGDPLLTSPESKKEVFDAGTAFIMADILRTAVNRGTGKNARIYPGNDTIPVAGKTGTTTNNYNLWFCGFTPYYAGALWVGNDVNLELVGAGGSVSAKMWSKIMTQIHEDLPPKNFDVPDGLIRATIDTASGKLAGAGSAAAGRARGEYFVKGTQPTTYDTTAKATEEAIEPPEDTVMPPGEGPVDQVEELPPANQTPVDTENSGPTDSLPAAGEQTPPQSSPSSLSGPNEPQNANPPVPSAGTGGQ